MECTGLSGPLSASEGRIRGRSPLPPAALAGLGCVTRRPTPLPETPSVGHRASSLPAVRERLQARIWPYHTVPSADMSSPGGPGLQLGGGPLFPSSGASPEEVRRMLPRTGCGLLASSPGPGLGCWGAAAILVIPHPYPSSFSFLPTPSHCSDEEYTLVL